MQKSYDPWPGPDEDVVIEAMLADPDSYHWSRCYELVEKLVQQWASDLSLDDKPEVVQNVMMRVVQYLPTFRRGSKLSTWLVKVVRSRRADEFRKLQSSHSMLIVSLDVFPRMWDDDTESIDLPTLLTTEEEFLQREELREIYEALLKHLAEQGKHRKGGKQERNSKILDLYLDGLNQQEIARELRIPAPVVGYVIRSIQTFARDYRGRQPPSPS